MATQNMEADKMLDVYIYDYLVKRKYSTSAKIFHTEAGLPAKPSAIDTPGGFLFEWWSIFWDVFISRYKRPGSKTEEQLQQQKLQQSSQQQWLEQMQLQLILQNIEKQKQQQQQQQRDETQLQSSTSNSNIARQNVGFRNPLAEKINLQQKVLQPRSSENVSQHCDASHATLLRSSGIGCQLPRQLPHDATPSNLRYFQAMKDQNQQTLTSQAITPATYLREPSSDGSLIRVTESDPAANNSPLEGWPLSVFQQQLIKNNQYHNEHIQPIQLGQQFQQPNYQDQQPDKVDAAGSHTDYAAISNTAREYNQATENQILRKRKQPMSSVDPANISGFGNISGSKTSASMPSIDKTGPHGDSSSDTNIFCSGSLGPQTLGANQLAVSDNNGSLAGNVDSFLSSSNPGLENVTAVCLESSRDITLSEVGIIHANLVNHCDFSSDGKLIATSGNDEKIMLWCVDTREEKCILEEHTDLITDIRFSPRLPRIATSSRDKTVKIWNANNPGDSLRSFVGHAPVMSLDFHPKKEDLVCSCDDSAAIRYWSIKSGGCTGLSKADATQVRFQPIHGRYLAAAVRSGVSIIDVETAQTYGYSLKGHATNVISVCWNSTGEYLASLSEDLIRVWKVGSGETQDCIHELSISSKKFNCCVFHPCYSSSLVIGFNQSLELWNMAENKMATLLEQPINALAVSQRSVLVASAGDDNLIKLWK